jgi:hypothetical protein
VWTRHLSLKGNGFCSDIITHAYDCSDRNSTTKIHARRKCPITLSPISEYFIDALAHIPMGLPNVRFRGESGHHKFRP